MSGRRDTLVFELPLPQQNGNGRGHWSGKYRRRKEYWEECDNSVLLKQNPRAPTIPWAHPVAEIQMRTFRKMDRDNAEARLKDLLDWLESRGYIVNDRDLTYKLDAVTAPRDDLGVTVVLREAA